MTEALLETQLDSLRPMTLSDAKMALLANPSGAVIVEASSRFPGELHVGTLDHDQTEFVEEHSDYLSPYGVLNDLFMLRTLVDTLEAEGRTVVFLESTAAILRGFHRFSEPLEVEGLVVPSRGGQPGKLFPYQQFCLRRIYALNDTSPKWNGFFVSLDTGTGKTVVATAIVRELVVNREDYDLVIAFAPAKLKINLSRSLEAATGMEFRVIEGPKDKRLAAYGEMPKGIILNYERAHHDMVGLLPLVRRRRVLFICDEVQKILQTGTSTTIWRKAVNKLIRAAGRSFVVPMSATVVKKDPLRFHDVFGLTNKHHPLGGRGEFKRDYLRTVFPWEPRPTGKQIEDWDPIKLEGVRHRVAIQTQAVRKTDPGVRELFRDMTTQVERVQMSDFDRKIYDEIVEATRNGRVDGSPMSPIWPLLLRGVCNTVESLLHVDSDDARAIVERHGADKFTANTSSKFEMIVEKIESIRDQGDKVVVFTAWTKMSLFLLEKQLAKRGITYVTHHGGMSGKVAQVAQDTFKADPSITVFLTSDAGAFGLNFQEARYVIHVDVPINYDTYKQRSDRIDRADSYLDGLTSYAYVTDGTVERRSWRKMNASRRLAAITLGTTEVTTRPSAEELNRMQRVSSSSMDALVFGDADDDMDDEDYA